MKNAQHIEVEESLKQGFRGRPIATAEFMVDPLIAMLASYSCYFLRDTAWM